MKHIWVVESSGGRKWTATSKAVYFVKSRAKKTMSMYAALSPGLKWRVAKYARVGGEK